MWLRPLRRTLPIRFVGRHAPWPPRYTRRPQKPVHPAPIVALTALGGTETGRLGSESGCRLVAALLFGPQCLPGIGFTYVARLSSLGRKFKEAACQSLASVCRATYILHS
jgi:hypothetical protein